MADETMAPAPSPPSTSVATRVVAVVAAGAGAVAALLPGIAAAQAGAFLAVAALVVLLAWRRVLPQAQRAALVAIPLLTLVVLVPELVPLPPPSDALERASAAAEAQWSGLLGRLDVAVAEPPPAGGDFRWIGPRREQLGPATGVAVLDARTLSPLAWSGWTTPLDGAEAGALRERLALGPATLVLRRGLALRLFHARTHESAPLLIVAAEYPLPTEPDPGPLAPPAELGVEARVRWQSLGEGLRADVDVSPAVADDPAMWSLVPLMASPRSVAARLSLGARPHADDRHAQETRRRALVALILAVAVMSRAFVDARAALWGVVLARVLLLLTAPALRHAGAIGSDAPWAAWARATLGEIPAAFVDTPASAVITGIGLVALAGLMPLPARLATRRVATALAALALLAGWPLALVITRAAALGPLEITAAHGDLAARWLALLALAALPWAASLALARLLGRDRTLAVVLGAATAGFIAGIGHGAGVAPGARATMETTIVPEIRDRVLLWRDALRETIDLAVPPAGSGRLAPERDAIDLWWKSALGEHGLASGVWRFGADGRLEDAFLSGIPPVEPEPLLTASPAGTIREPESAVLRFVGGDVALLVAEVARTEGGSWLLAVHDTPDNVPSRADADPLRGLRSRTRPPGSLPDSLGRRPALAWFDAGGRLVGSDLLEAPPAPPARQDAARWRELVLEGRRADVLEIPDPQTGGSVAAVTFRPGGLQRAALALGWAAALAIAALALRLVRLLLGTPRQAWRGALQALRLVANSFRTQLGLVLVAAGLLPLLALGMTSRAVAHRNANRQMLAAAAAQTSDARRFIEDYLALGAGGATLDDAVAAWLARTIGADLFAWRQGALLATSRPDLVRAGLWPERAEGEVWDEITRGRRALLVVGGERPVVHAPVLGPDGEPGVLSVPLGAIGARIEEGLAEVDRALLASAVLLLALATAIAVPAARRMVRPLEDLQSATSAIAGGRFDARVPETGYEETRALARAFREMALSLAEQRLSLERRRLAMEALIAGMPVAVVATQADGTVWAANPRAAELLGAHAGAPLPERDDDGLSETCRALLRAPGDISRGFDVPSDDTRRHLRASAHDLPATQHEDEPTRLLVIEDVSDTVRSERLLAWAGMARRIAHEIKNPLTPISLIVDHVRRMKADDHPDLPRALERMLDTIAEQVRVLRETSREFSDYARLLVARPEPIDLAASLETWLDAYRVVPPKGARFSLAIGEGLGRVVADPRLLRRAFVNLVDNALAAIGEGGCIAVTARRDLGPEPRIVIAVEDDGPGVPASLVSKLFEPDVTTRETGTGLGLPIARQSIEAQGGTLELDVAHEGGARFVISLPEPHAPL